MTEFPNFPSELSDITDAQDEFISDTYEEINVDTKKCYRCTFNDCGKIFRFKSEITRHVVIHFNSRPYRCDYEGCKKTFKRSDALSNHRRTHTKLTPFECNVPDCDQKFSTKAALRYHLIKHNNEKTFQCSFPGCNKAFLTKGQLKQHEKALNYHLMVSGSETQEEPVKVLKSHEKDQESIYEDFFSPSPKPAEILEWETRDISDENNNVNVDQQEDFEKIVKYILKENKLLKQKIELCSKLMDKFHENQTLKAQLDDQYILDPVTYVEPEPSSFFNENEFRFLDFLKGQDEGGF